MGEDRRGCSRKSGSASGADPSKARPPGRGGDPNGAPGGIRMGARTLDTKLRGRLLAVVGPALVMVGAASVALVAWALDAADTDAARAKAESALATMHGE